MVKFYKVDFPNKLSEMGVTYALDLFVSSASDDNPFTYVLDRNGYLAINTKSESMHYAVCDFLMDAGATIKELKTIEEHG